MLNVECLANDVDVSSKMTRELFEEKSQSILERVKLPLQKVSRACSAGHDLCHLPAPKTVRLFLQRKIL